jgi:hypothetical protein
LEIGIHNSLTQRLQARDFHVGNDETGLDTWTAEKLDYVLAAINGAPVIITVNAFTDFTVIGATIALNEARDQLALTKVDDDEIFHFDLDALGSEIIPIGAFGALNAALTALRAGL